MYIFICIEKFKNKRDTDDFLIKNKVKFFPDQNNHSELNAFFEKLWSTT